MFDDGTKVNIHTDIKPPLSIKYCSKNYKNTSFPTGFKHLGLAEQSSCSSSSSDSSADADALTSLSFLGAGLRPPFLFLVWSGVA